MHKALINEAFDRLKRIDNVPKRSRKIYESINPVNFRKLKTLVSKLRYLNEARMSDEDRKDSDNIRSAYNKLNARKNAKLTKDEKDVLNKYGIEMSYKYGDTPSKGRKSDMLVNHPGLEQEVDKYDAYSPYGDKRLLARGSDMNNDKINYADMARKRATRTGEYSNIGKQGHLKYGGNSESEIDGYYQNRALRKNYNRLKRILRDRESEQKYYNPFWQDPDKHDKKMQQYNDDINRMLKRKNRSSDDYV